MFKLNVGNKDTALLVAGLIFGVVSLVHLSRIFLEFNLIIARQMVPQWVSYPGFVIFFLLSLWMFAAKNNKSKK